MKHIEEKLRLLRCISIHHTSISAKGRTDDKEKFADATCKK